MHKQKLLKDPRFAGWAAGELEPVFGADEHPGQRQLTEEQRELFRRVAVSALQHSNNGARLEPEARSWAQHWAAIKPLGRALSTGEAK